MRCAHQSSYFFLASTCHARAATFHKSSASETPLWRTDINFWRRTAVHTLGAIENICFVQENQTFTLFRCKNTWFVWDVRWNWFLRTINFAYVIYFPPKSVKRFDTFDNLFPFAPNGFQKHFEMNNGLTFYPIENWNLRSSITKNFIRFTTQWCYFEKFSRTYKRKLRYNADGIDWHEKQTK